MKNIETEDEESIGYANMYMFNEYEADSWEELLYIADSISGDVLEVIDVLSKAKENEEISGLISVIDHIEIDKDRRGQGHCSFLIDKILDYFEYISVNYVGLIPARIYVDKVVQNENKAIEYYVNKGFKPISRRVAGNIVMGKSLL
jgi:GNAT superfamily N-acetyltransferase